MVHNRVFKEAVSVHGEGSSFEAAAWAHLKSLEDAGETPDQIVRQLSDVVASYATDGLEAEANTLREVVRQYQLRLVNDGARST